MNTSPFTLPELPYDYDALEPHIDSATMKVHHQKHHQGYINQLNAALEKIGAKETSLNEVLRKSSYYGPAIMNHAGGHKNHSLFWESLSPKGERNPKSSISQAIENQFGSYQKFLNAFNKKAAAHFGSGWAWLCADQYGTLQLCTTPNQENPLMYPACASWKLLLGLDLWEHAYYLKYQNRRPEYIDAFWNVINWQVVNNRWESPSLPT